ncbi:MAG TPA: sulfur carrier protein ThiS [Longimicrobiales bacterium]|nr:sulfur carrier protein ThiS [Longimicrobiales bacterium]
MTDAETITVVVNGSPRELPGGRTVAGILDVLDLHPGLVVVERNGDILRRAAYAEVPVQDGDRLELVHFVGGG